MANIKKNSNISGVILAGGKSRRMGRDKRTLEWGGTKFLDKVCFTLSELFDEIILVTAIEDYPCGHLPVRLVTDTIPHQGSLGGLFTGIKEASCGSVFGVACETPFLNPSVISRLCSLPENDVVMPKLSTGYQPLHARYSKRCSIIMEKMIQEGNLRIQSLIQEPSLSIQIVEETFFDDIDPFGYSFLNINTPADYEFARKAAAHLQ